MKNSHHTKRDRILYDVKRTLLVRALISNIGHSQTCYISVHFEILVLYDFFFLKNGLAECKCKEAIAVVQRATVTLNLRYCVPTFLAIRQGNANVRCAHECNLSVRARTSYRHCLPQECS